MGVPGRQGQSDAKMQSGFLYPYLPSQLLQRIAMPFFLGASQVPWLEYQAAKDEWDAEKQRFEVVKGQLAEKQRGLRQQEGPLK